MSNIHEYRSRVIKEKADLDDKLERLNAFYDTDIYKNLPEDERVRLAEKQHFMEGYSKVLEKSIEAFSNDMKYEAIQDFSFNGWRVDFPNYDKGYDYLEIVNFYGPNAEQRAREYADWKNGKR